MIEYPYALDIRAFLTAEYFGEKNVISQKVLNFFHPCSQAPLYLGQFDTILLHITNMLVIFYRNFLILKSFKRKIKLSAAQLLSYHTHF